MAAPLLNPHMFRAYDIRGVAGKDLTEPIAERVGRAYATLLRRSYGVDRAVVGRDNRPSSDELRDGLVRGLRASGVSVVDIGLSPSPLQYFAAASWGIDGGSNVTASHNPAQYNGFKLLERRGIPLSSEEIQEVRRIAEAGDFEEGEGGLESREAIPEYVDLLASRFKLSRPLRVMVDPANAVATLTGPEALRRIGAEVQGINLELDGTFPAHLPDPQDPATMEGLREAVRESGADLGIAWDGDGDRMGLVDEQGVRHDPDAVVAIFARDLLSRHPGARILVDVKMSLTAVDDIRAHGGEPVFGPTGHSLVKRKLRDEGFLLGGEGSGHFYFAEDYYGVDDAVYAACLVARLLAEANQPASELFADLPRYVTSEEIKLASADDKKFGVVAKVVSHFREAYPVMEVDGARIDFGDGWALVRASNTGPVLTVRFEAKTQERQDEIREIVWEVLSRDPEVSLPEVTPRA